MVFPGVVAAAGRSVGTSGVPRAGRDHGRSPSEKHDRIASRVASFPQGVQARPRRDREPSSEFWDPGHRSPIDGGISQQQDHPVETQIALLCSDSPLEGLDIRQSGLGLDQYPECRTIDDDVGAAEVTGDGDRDFRAPSKFTRDAVSHALDEGEVRSIPHWWPGRVEAHREFEAKHGGDLRHEFDRE